MIKTYSQAISYLRCYIPKNQNRFPGDLGLKRQGEILRLLGNPQNKIKAIHLAGTSGKGSTAFYISSLLVSHGFNVGLTLSPHLLDIRERFQINNQLISKKEFVFYLSQIIPVIEKIKLTSFGVPTFFEILIALSFYIFYQKKVDYIVVETGLGGLMDGTNTITSSNQVVVITKLGLDHTAILGSNLKSIAFQKAGIIHQKNPVFSIKQLSQAKKVLDESASKNKTKINYISPKINFKNIKFKNQTITYDFKFNDLNINQIHLNTIGLYQVDNSALSLSVLKFLSTRDHFNLDINQIRNTFLNSHFFGRADIYQKENQFFILDGAHNPQKMRSLVSSLKKAYPDQKFVFILAFKQRHDFPQMIKSIIPIAQKIILTSFNIRFQDMAQISQSASSIITLLNKLNFKNYQIALTPKSAYLMAKKTKQSTIITGSLYLLPKIYPFLVS